MKHMTLSEIADACCGIYCGDPAFLDCEVSSVAIDSSKRYSFRCDQRCPC